MSLEATTISLIALFVSILSLLLSLYNSDVDRRIQIEQLKGEMTTRLTFRGIEMLGYIKKLDMQKPEVTDVLKKNLIKVVDGIIEARRNLRTYPKSSPFFGSDIFTSLQRMRNDIEDAEPVFDKLREAFTDCDLKSIEQITDGLIERFFGSKSTKDSKTTMPNGSLKHDR